MKATKMLTGIMFAVFMLFGIISTAGATLEITPSYGILDSTRWEIFDLPSNLDADDIEGIVGYAELTEVYKQNVGDASDTGSFAGSYSTVFDMTPEDPSMATITWEGEPNPFISGSPLYLHVKDGNADPCHYIFDVTGAWDGKETIELSGFWPSRGAISHVAIFQGEGTSVPEPGSLMLLGLGLVGLGTVARKRFRK